MPKPSLDNSSEWVTWRANQVATPTWWVELSTVPRKRDVEEFAWMVLASFKLPKRSSCVSDTTNGYSTLPAPHPLEHDWFLTISNIMYGRQDYCIK